MLSGPAISDGSAQHYCMWFTLKGFAVSAVVHEVVVRFRLETIWFLMGREISILRLNKFQCRTDEDELTTPDSIVPAKMR